MKTGPTTRRALIGALLLIAVLLAILWYELPLGSRVIPGKERRAQILQPPPTPEPLVPTPLPVFRWTATPSDATSSPTSTPAPATSSAQTSQAGVVTGRARIGVGVPVGDISDYDWAGSMPGWYLNWHVTSDPALPDGTYFAQMVRVSAKGFQPDIGTIQAAAVANPGALWLIGNEPDVAWQDNVTPEQYAASYGTLYRAIKEVDPTAQVAIGGVSQPTPLRMAYLDRILAAYRTRYGTEMPVDVWNVHAFILREERDSWGVGIPPGMGVDQGQLYEIGDHADMTLFRLQIEDFRRWMAERGLRDKPLIVSEYGILMPESYGFPPELVGRFMTDTFDYFLTARDPDTGYPADDDRLVQAFCWYSAADTMYTTSNLFDPETHAITPVGEVFRDYVAGLR